MKINNLWKLLAVVVFDLYLGILTACAGSAYVLIEAQSQSLAGAALFVFFAIVWVAAMAAGFAPEVVENKEQEKRKAILSIVLFVLVAVGLVILSWINQVPVWMLLSSVGGA